MSTEYLITSKRLPTLKDLTDFGLRAYINREGAQVITNDIDCVQVAFNGKHIISFTRFGANDPQFLITSLALLGFEATSEDDI
jgi:hypothetical protein